MLFTIFTPAYNRAFTLPRLYQSILRQSFMDFEWVIVNDGSSDITDEVVQGFIDDGKIKIRYEKQDNGGKHTAVNRGISLAKGDFFVIIDSDDYFIGNALKEMAELANQTTQNPDVAGFAVIHFMDNVNYNPDLYGKKKWLHGAKHKHHYNWEHHGEFQFGIKTDILRKNLFPVFPGEKFVAESTVIWKLGETYDFLFSDKVLYSGEYLDEGLSANYYSMLKQSPRGALLNYRVKIEQYTTWKQKKEAIKLYMRLALQSPSVPFNEKFLKLNPIYTIIGISEIIKKKILG